MNIQERKRNSFSVTECRQFAFIHINQLRVSVAQRIGAVDLYDSNEYQLFKGQHRLDPHQDMVRYIGLRTVPKLFIDPSLRVPSLSIQTSQEI